MQGSNPDHEFCKLPKYKHLIVAAAKKNKVKPNIKLGKRDRNMKPPRKASADREKASLAQALGSSSYHHHITQP